MYSSRLIFKLKNTSFIQFFYFTKVKRILIKKYFTNHKGTSRRYESVIFAPRRPTHDAKCKGILKMQQMDDV